MNLLACTGGRNYSYRKIVYDVLDRYVPTRVFVGDCLRGVDWLVVCWCRERNVPVTVFAADWKRFGLRAGPIRNRQMMEALREEGGKILLAFPGGKGTLSCKKVALELGLDVKEVGDDLRCEYCRSHFSTNESEIGCRECEIVKGVDVKILKMS